MTYSTDAAFAITADAQDTLKEFRKQFRIPLHNGKEQIYFLGNSLGLQPVSTAAAINEVLDQWAQFGVEAFFHGSKPWLDFHDTLKRPLSRIVGAHAGEVVVMNQLTVNLHLLMVSFYRPSGKRKKIICEAKAFPSDQYMLETHIRHYGFDPAEIIIEVAPRENEFEIRMEDITAAIERHGEELALVLWGGVNYYTGQVFDIAAITSAAHKAGALAGFDLAHAAGNIILHLHDWNVDFACWCSYKYLNSGPGAIAGAYIHERYHNDNTVSRFAGWWGYDKASKFKMQPGFVPVNSAEGWQLSTPSMILYAAHKAALDIFDAAGIENLAVKGEQLSSYLVYLLSSSDEDLLPDPPENILPDPERGLLSVPYRGAAFIREATSPPGRGRGGSSPSGEKLQIITPENKGCQVSILIKENGRKVFDQLAAHGIFADWREPDVIRVAPVPLYNTFSEVRQFSQTLNKLLHA